MGFGRLNKTKKYTRCVSVTHEWMNIYYSLVSSSSNFFHFTLKRFGNGTLEAAFLSLVQWKGNLFRSQPRNRQYLQYYMKVCGDQRKLCQLFNGWRAEQLFADGMDDGSMKLTDHRGVSEEMKTKIHTVTAVVQKKETF